jgi:16S rRNA (uracil1498-N3)-methyltransferase
MHHFFVTATQINASTVIFPEDIAHQIKRVLRLREGDQVNVLDNRRNIYKTELVFEDSNAVTGHIISTAVCESEPHTELSLYIGLTQREKFEWILQKGTELGVSRFVPFISERSLVQKTAVVEKKEQRWQKIVQEAAEQCKRGKIPVIEPAMDYKQAVTHAKTNHEISLIPWEETTSGGIQAVFANDRPATVAILIGPEGGFSAAEVETAVQAGIMAVTLGKRILRMETAALAAAAMVMFALGEME